VVQPGDTLSVLARRYEVPARALIEANNLEPPYALSAGRRLVLPQVQAHRVEPGETLTSIARRHGVEASALAAANRLAPPFTVRTGTLLIVPPRVEPVVAAAAPPAPDPAASPPPAPPVPSAKPAPPPFAASAARERPSVAALPGPAASEPPATALAAAPPPAAAAPPDAEAQHALAPPPSHPPAPESAPAPPSGKGFIWPVKGRLLSGYGPGANGTHNDGVNLAAPRGTPIRAAEEGVVAYAGNELRGFGNLVLVKHPGGWITAYAHCDSVAVKKGEKVRRGEVIAKVGETGTVTEPQLHFELRRGTRALDPMDYLAPLPTASLLGVAMPS